MQLERARGGLAAEYDRRVAAGAIRDDPRQRAVLARLEAIRSGLEATSPRHGFLGRLRRNRASAPRGLYLWGDVGRGKSMLMDLFFAGTDIARKRRVHFHAFMQEVHERLDTERRKGTADALRPVADALAENARLLCLDEMQITDIADAMIVGRLFARLIERGVTVVTTSNRPPEQLYKDGLNRQLFTPFIALLRKALDVVALDGATDYRRDRLADRPLWHVPVDAQARASMDALWDALAGGPGAPLVLEVKGRSVILPEVRNGVARTSFDALCGHALGPADYLAIAEAVRVLMIDDIPALTRADRDKAVRFITLIDALYEARTCIAATAAAPPEALYRKGERSFEFARTASRIAEMISADWFAHATSRGDQSSR